MIVSSGPARELTGLSERQMRRCMKPLKKTTEGKGCHVTLNMVDLTALLYVSRLQEEGFGSVIIQDALEFFSKLSLKKMLNCFRGGKICLLPIRGCMKLIELPTEVARGSTFDVEATYKEMLASVKKYAKEHPQSQRGPGRICLFDAEATAARN